MNTVLCVCIYKSKFDIFPMNKNINYKNINITLKFDVIYPHTKKKYKILVEQKSFFFLDSTNSFLLLLEVVKKKKIQRGDEIDQLIFIHREIQIIDVVELVVIKGPEYLGKDMI